MQTSEQAARPEGVRIVAATSEELNGAAQLALAITDDGVLLVGYCNPKAWGNHPLDYDEVGCEGDEITPERPIKLDVTSGPGQAFIAAMIKTARFKLERTRAERRSLRASRKAEMLATDEKASEWKINAVIEASGEYRDLLRLENVFEADCAMLNALIGFPLTRAFD